MLSELLRKRGIEGDAELEEFLSPSPKLAYDPFLLANMHAGVDLLLDAIYSGSKIVIYRLSHRQCDLLYTFQT